MKFLYLMRTELWGRREKAGAGNGKTGTSGVVVRQANPSDNTKTLSGPKLKVGKPVSELPRKAAIDFHKPVP